MKEQNKYDQVHSGLCDRVRIFQDMIRRRQEKAPGGVRVHGDSRLRLRRQTTTTEYDDLELNFLNIAIILKTFRGKDGEENSMAGKGDASMYTVADEGQSFGFGDDNGGWCEHLSDSRLWYVYGNFRSQFRPR